MSEVPEDPWEEAEYCEYLEAERRLYAWCLMRLGGVAPEAAAQKALKRYPYEPPDAPLRGSIFHFAAWDLAVTKLYGHVHRDRPRIDPDLRDQYEVESECLHHRKGDPLACDKALSIAQADARSAYADLSVYRVQLALEEDGWHVDYELKDPPRKGGGPHYIIDARTGAIRSKRYEQ